MVAVVALPVTAPVRFEVTVVAVIALAEKLPFASRTTTFEAVFVSVASTAHVVAAEPLKFEPVRYVPRVRVFVVFAVIVISAEPLNDTPLIKRAFWNVVAVVALPLSAPVNVDAHTLLYRRAVEPKLYVVVACGRISEFNLAAAPIVNRFVTVLFANVDSATWSTTLLERVVVPETVRFPETLKSRPITTLALRFTPTPLVEETSMSFTQSLFQRADVVPSSNVVVTPGETDVELTVRGVTLTAALLVNTTLSDCWDAVVL